MDIVERDNFLTEKECKEIINMLPSGLTKETIVVIDENLISELVKIVNSRVPEFSFTNHVTVGFTTKAIIKHIDPKLDPRVTHRMYIYLQVPSKGGGTFFDDYGRIEPKVGKAVIFDINLYHRGEEFPPGETKKIVGFRMFKA